MALGTRKHSVARYHNTPTSWPGTGTRGLSLNRRQSRTTAYAGCEEGTATNPLRPPGSASRHSPAPRATISPASALPGHLPRLRPLDTWYATTHTKPPLTCTSPHHEERVHTCDHRGIHEREVPRDLRLATHRNLPRQPCLRSRHAGFTARAPLPSPTYPHS